MITWTAKLEQFFCLNDDVLRALHHLEYPYCEMSDAEVMTTTNVAALQFCGNFGFSCKYLQDEGYIPHMLVKSRINRRLHRLHDLFFTLFQLLGETWKGLNNKSIYVIDSYPIASCDNYRICRSKRCQGEAWRGCQTSKERFFYRLKIHIVVT